MNGKMDRRQALGAIGAVSLGGLLAACGDDDDTSGSVRTSTGKKSTVETKTTPSTGAAAESNSDGIVEFRTIYPGWYPGRTTHIHLKVHLDRRTVLTSQLFTNRDIDAKVYAREPYAQDSGRDTFNDTDGIYAGSGELTLSMQGEAVRGVITLDVERG